MEEGDIGQEGAEVEGDVNNSVISNSGSGKVSRTSNVMLFPETCI